MDKVIKEGEPRVVLLGFNKCGTRSFWQLFVKSGYRALHNHFKDKDVKELEYSGQTRNAAKLMEANIAQKKRPFEGFENFTFYGDLEFLDSGRYVEGIKRYREIQTAYPDTVFILNTREKEGWINSRRRHQNGRYLEVFKRYLGVSSDEECFEHWSQAWDAHLQGVRRYFSDSDQLIEFDIESDEIDPLIEALPHTKLKRDGWQHIGKT